MAMLGEDHDNQASPNGNESSDDDTFNKAPDVVTPANPPLSKNQWRMLKIKNRKEIRKARAKANPVYVNAKFFQHLPNFRTFKTAKQFRSFLRRCCGVADRRDALSNMPTETRDLMLSGKLPGYQQAFLAELRTIEMERNPNYKQSNWYKWLQQSPEAAYNATNTAKRDPGSLQTVDDNKPLTKSQLAKINKIEQRKIRHSTVYPREEFLAEMKR